MNISNHQIVHVLVLLIFILSLIYNNIAKNPLKPISWNWLFVILIISTLIQIYKTYKTETNNSNVI